MTSADIMSTRDSHLNQNKYVLPTTLCHYALQNGLKLFLKEIFFNLRATKSTKKITPCFDFS